MVEKSGISAEKPIKFAMSLDFCCKILYRKTHT